MERTPGGNTQKRSSRPSDTKAGRCSYTFIVPQQKLTGALCVNTQSAAANQTEVSALRMELARQQEQLEKIRAQLEQEGSLAMEVRALRRDSNSMNSRIAQLYAQLLHEVIHKKDQALELRRVENLLLNATTQVSRPSTSPAEIQLMWQHLFQARLCSGPAGVQQLPGAGEEIRSPHFHHELPESIYCSSGEAVQVHGVLPVLPGREQTCMLHFSAWMSHRVKECCLLCCTGVDGTAKKPF